MSDEKKVYNTKDDLKLASECIKDAACEVKKKAEEYSDQISEYIKNCPLKSVIIASAIGLLIGKLFI